VIETVHLDGVAVLTMRHGKVNAMDPGRAEAEPSDLAYGHGGGGAAMMAGSPDSGVFATSLPGLDREVFSHVEEKAATFWPYSLLRARILHDKHPICTSCHVPHCRRIRCAGVGHHASHPHVDSGRVRRSDGELPDATPRRTVANPAFPANPAREPGRRPQVAAQARWVRALARARGSGGCAGGRGGRLACGHGIDG